MGQINLCTTAKKYPTLFSSGLPPNAWMQFFLIRDLKRDVEGRIEFDTYVQLTAVVCDKNGVQGEGNSSSGNDNWCQHMYI